MISPKNTKSGFSLIEVLVATAITGIASAIMMSSFIFLLKAHATDQGKLLINRDIRSFTNDLMDATGQATTFSIFDNFINRNEMTDTESGDFLLLEFRDSDEPSKISRIVGFYRAADSETNRGPVQTFELNFSTPTDSTALSLIPAPSTSGSHTEVVELSEGLANGRLFLNFRESSIVVRGELVHNGPNGDTVSNTYNLTVSPRG